MVFLFSSVDSIHVVITQTVVFGYSAEYFR